MFGTQDHGTPVRLLSHLLILAVRARGKGGARRQVVEVRNSCSKGFERRSA